VLALGLFFPATGSEFVSESLDLRFESVDALGFPVSVASSSSTRSLNSRFFSARYARLRSESAAPTSGDDPPGCRPRYRRRRPGRRTPTWSQSLARWSSPVRRPVSVVDLVPLLPKQSRLPEQLLHLRPVATGPERQQTTQGHIGLGLTVVADRIPVPEPLELRRSTRFALSRRSSSSRSTSTSAVPVAVTGRQCHSPARTRMLCHARCPGRTRGESL